MPDERDQYERQHLRNLQQKEKEIKKLYEDSIHEVVVSYSQVNYNGQTFYLKDYPALLNKINAQIKKLHASIYTATVNGIENSWDLSNYKNNIFVDKRLAGKKASVKAKQTLYDPNIDALESYLTRKVKGLNLSDRVWNSLDGYKTEMEAALGVGISEGKPANRIATDLKKYLVDPDKLFRRVREIKGDPNSKLILSRAAMNYHPGQGRYRSSFLNAKRVAVAETNGAYRNSDILRWRTMPFVKAYRINLSNNHPEYDICDELQGVYPLWFNWVSWHVFCLCYLTAEQISEAEFQKMEDEILATGKAPKIEKLEEMPTKFNEYVERNAERINSWKSKPYWLKFNPSLAKELL